MEWGYIGGMPKVSVYLPDALYAEVQSRGLPLSSITQEALRRALAQDDRREWVRRVSERPPRTTRRIDTAALLDDVRDELGA